MKFAIALAIALFGIQSASAACTKPVGRFVGTGGGADYSVINSTVSNAGTLQFSAAIPASGQWTIDFWAISGSGKKSGRFSISGIGSGTNKFDSSLCRGQTTTSIGGLYSYVVSEGGNVIELMYFKDERAVSAWFITLRKV